MNKYVTGLLISALTVCSGNNAKMGTVFEDWCNENITGQAYDWSCDEVKQIFEYFTNDSTRSTAVEVFIKRNLEVLRDLF